MRHPFTVAQDILHIDNRRLMPRISPALDTVITNYTAMKKQQDTPFIWIKELQWFSQVDTKSTTSYLSLWQSILYIMEKNRIAVEEAKLLRLRLLDLEDKALAEYINEAMETDELLHYAVPKKRTDDDKKPKSVKQIPPKTTNDGEPVVYIESEAHLQQLIDEERQEQSKYIDGMTISPEDALSWLNDLEEARLDFLSDCPIAASIHAFIRAEIRKARAIRRQEQNKIADARKKVAPQVKSKTNHLQVPPLKPAEKSVLEMQWNDVLPDHPLPSISKASLNKWPMLRAFECLADPTQYERRLVKENTKTVNGTIKALLLYIGEADPDHKTEGKIDPRRVAKSLAKVAAKQKQWVPPVATMTSHLKKLMEK